MLLYAMLHFTGEERVIRDVVGGTSDASPEEPAVDEPNDSDSENDDSKVEDYIEDASIPVIMRILTERFIPMISAFAANHAEEVLHWDDEDSDDSSSSDDSDEDV